MKAIERIAGYACEVNEKQWRELVKVADEVGVPVNKRSRDGGTSDGLWRVVEFFEEELWIDTHVEEKRTAMIPYPDFLAKLKGEEKWEPKNGEEVEVSVGRPSKWVKAEFVCIHKTYYICSLKDEWQYLPFTLNLIRPLRPTITRAEAEQKLKELGVNARIVD